MIPYVSREQITQLDRLMVDHFRIPIIMMMEQAGYRLAEFIRTIDRKHKPVIICVGKGNNGGDGIAAARHLLNFGYTPRIFLIADVESKESQMNLMIAKRFSIPTFSSFAQLERECNDCGTIVDCLIGYSLRGAPRPPFDKVIRLINTAKKPTVSCDIPSGIDADDGKIYAPSINPTHILSLSLPKAGIRNIEAEKFVADIGVPRSLYPLIGITPKNYFEKSSIIKIR